MRTEHLQNVCSVLCYEQIWILFKWVHITSFRWIWPCKFGNLISYAREFIERNISVKVNKEKERNKNFRKQIMTMNWCNSDVRASGGDEILDWEWEFPELLHYSKCHFTSTITTEKFELIQLQKQSIIRLFWLMTSFRKPRNEAEEYITDTQKVLI